jgi:hypothetical protein
MMLPPKVRLLAGIVGPSVSCGLFLGIALMSLKRALLPVEIVFLVAVLLLAGAALFIAIRSCSNVLKLLP